MQKVAQKMLVAVVGTRTNNKDSFMNVYRQVHEVITKYIKPGGHYVVSGGASSGADKAARLICFRNKIQYVEVPANWHPDPEKPVMWLGAGPYRNTAIAEICTHLVAFWDGKSSGTKDVIIKVQNLGKPVWVVPV